MPWYKSSNYVVKLVRIFADTFLARTLNIIFATSPLLIAKGFPREQREAVEEYMNIKAMRVWGYYNLTKQFIHAGNKNGTCPIKTIYETTSQWSVSQGKDEEHSTSEKVIYDGPRSRVIPFDDFNVYPITANSIEEAKIIFQRNRYFEYDVRQKIASGKWQLDLDTMLRGMVKPNDYKRQEEQENAGISVNYGFQDELQTVECHLDYPITNDPDRYYPIVGLICPKLRRLVDVYFAPYPVTPFSLYRPFPRENLIFGESVCEVLDQSQEEASSIHNDRRNNSTLANSVMVKRRSGATTPNASTNWYPSKVWDVESMDDLEIINNVGRNYTDMVSEEQFTLQLASQLMGISDVMQGSAQGQQTKGGYNAAGTLGVLSEGNQRQDTNIRDVRLVLSEVARTAWILQKTFGKDDPIIKTLSPETQRNLTLALNSPEIQQALVAFDVQSSDAGANKEIRKTNLVQMSQTLGATGQAVLQLTQQYLQLNNPTIQNMIQQVFTMTKGLAQELLLAFDLGELEELVPDLDAALKGGQGGGQTMGGPGANPAGPNESDAAAGGGVGQPVDNGGAGANNQPLSLDRLRSLAALPSGAGSNVSR